MRRIRRAGISTLAVLAAVAALASATPPTADAREAPASPNTDQARQRQDRAAATRVIRLKHPVALDAAIHIVVDQPVSELRVEGTNFGGALLLSPTKVEDVEEALRRPRAFTAAAGAQLAAVQLTTVDATPDELAQLARRLDALPRVSASKAGRQFRPGHGLAVPLKDRVTARAGGPAAARTATPGTPENPDVVIPNEDFSLDNLENAYPSAVFSELKQVGAGSTSTYNFSIGFTWDYVPTLGVLHHTQLWPDDWGLELGPTLYNDDLTDNNRPFCGFDGGDSDTDFFFETWESMADDATFFAIWNVPAAAEPYIDHEITFDDWMQNGLEIGVGKPRELSNNVSYYMAAWATQGTESSSLVGAAMSAKTNDCNNLGLPASSSCMGLNTNAEPDYIAGSQLLLNKDRERTAPLIFKTTDYWDEPMIVEPVVCPGPWCP